MNRIRRQGRRLAWLMAGAAIGLAVVLLVVVVVVMVAGGRAAPTGSMMVLVAALSLLLAGLLGLVPGVRELEVTGARSMLGADGELLVPHRARPAHHLQTGCWVALHLVTGLVVAGLLVTLVPTAALHLVELAVGRPLGSGMPLPGSAAGSLLSAAVTVLVGAAALLAGQPLGAGFAHLAPRLLGPTTTDRLELAHQRADREAERTRIARDLHDGIGHALSVVSLQAAGARAAQARDPEASAAALAAIEDTARAATAELDAMLAVLREEGRDLSPDGAGTGSEDLRQLLAARRRAGMELRTRIEQPEGLAELQRRHLVRALTELLTNAQRHGGPGPVEVALSGRAGRVLLEVTNPLGGPGDPGCGSGADDPGAAAPSGEHGLQGVRERAALLGGTLEAGPRAGCWVARLDLPLLTEEGPR